jgi:hypothetical protein
LSAFGCFSPSLSLQSLPPTSNMGCTNSTPEPAKQEYAAPPNTSVPKDDFDVPIKMSEADFDAISLHWDTSAEATAEWKEYVPCCTPQRTCLSCRFQETHGFLHQAQPGEAGFSRRKQQLAQNPRASKTDGRLVSFFTGHARKIRRRKCQSHTCRRAFAPPFFYMACLLIARGCRTLTRRTEKLPLTPTLQSHSR